MKSLGSKLPFLNFEDAILYCIIKLNFEVPLEAKEFYIMSGEDVTARFKIVLDGK